MRDRLIELIGSKVCEDYSPTCDEWQPHSCEKCFANDCRIGELADHLIANGVIVPPCKMGDKLYRIFTMESDAIPPWVGSDPETVKRIGVATQNILGNWNVFPMEYFGKTVFLTREEAENALKARKD